jgi:hypothetical protein
MFIDRKRPNEDRTRTQIFCRFKQGFSIGGPHLRLDEAIRKTMHDAPRFDKYGVHYTVNPTIPTPFFDRRHVSVPLKKTILTSGRKNRSPMGSCGKDSPIHRKGERMMYDYLTNLKQSCYMESREKVIQV